MLTCTYLGFAVHNTCTHIQAQKTHTRTRAHAHKHAHESSSPVLLSISKVRFVGEINPTLQNAPISIMLVFHKIIKAASQAFKSRVTAHLKSPLRRLSESRPTTRLKLYFAGFQKRCKSPLREISNFILPLVSSSTSLVFYSVAKARFAGFQIPQ